VTDVPRPRIHVSNAAPPPADDALLALPLTPVGGAPRPLADYERRLGLSLLERIDPRTIREDEGAVALTSGAPRVALLGLGQEVDEDAVRAAAAAAARAARGIETTLVWAFDDELLSAERQVRAVVDGVVLGGHDPARWKTTPQHQGLEELVIAGAPAALEEEASRTATIARWTNKARELVDAPPNELTPAGLAERSAALLDGLPVDVEILDLAGIERAGLHALAAVGRGSANEPRLIVLRYRAGSDPDDRLGLVGKGVTFDSGGYFLKPQNDIVRQKADMGGAAAVIGAVGAIAELGLAIDVLAVIPAAENMLGGAAYRPSDIIKTAAGLTVEVTNPDAEGRLLLADGIWFAKQEGVGRLVDVATLTGAMRGGMGDLYSGVFANTEGLREQIVDAGDASGDHVWPWPLHRRYNGPLESSLADIRNTAGRGFGYPIFAAAFLARFAGTVPWAHIDIHSTAFLDEARGYLGPGATGAGVRLLAELAARLADAT
jgi:leucyl aminopeptidase